MRQIVIHSALFLLSILFLAACGGSTQGPTTWFDQPLEGSQYPLAAITLQAHASDGDGIAKIQFLSENNLLGEVATAGRRLGDVMLEWMPPAPGSYTLVARAVDSQGNPGPPARVQIVVGEAVVATGTLTPATAQCASAALVAPALISPGNGDAVAPDPMLTWSYPDTTCHPYSYRIDISEDASFSDISLGFGTLSYTETSRAWPLPAGQCYYWRAMAHVPDIDGPASPVWQFCVGVEGSPTFTLDKNANCREGPGTAYEIDDTLMQGQTASIEGRNSDSSWWWVSRPSGSGHCWVSAITGQAAGDLTLVQIVGAPVPVEETPQQPTSSAVDTTPPVISNIYVDPTLIVADGCGLDTTSFVGATVSDESGVSRVIARIPGYGEVDMYIVGRDVYQVALGPFDYAYAGEMSIIIQAWDNAGNGASAGPLTLSIVCVE